MAIDPLRAKTAAPSTAGSAAVVKAVPELADIDARTAFAKADLFGLDGGAKQKKTSLFGEDPDLDKIASPAKPAPAAAAPAPAPTPAPAPAATPEKPKVVLQPSAPRQFTAGPTRANEPAAAPAPKPAPAPAPAPKAPEPVTHTPLFFKPSAAKVVTPSPPSGPPPPAAASVKPIAQPVAQPVAHPVAAPAPAPAPAAAPVEATSPAPEEESPKTPAGGGFAAAQYAERAQAPEEDESPLFENPNAEAPSIEDSLAKLSGLDIKPKPAAAAPRTAAVLFGGLGSDVAADDRNFSGLFVPKESLEAREKVETESSDALFAELSATESLDRFQSKPTSPSKPAAQPKAAAPKAAAKTAAPAKAPAKAATTAAKKPAPTAAATPALGAADLGEGFDFSAYIASNKAAQSSGGGLFD